jgi:hypothetical protein
MTLGVCVQYAETDLWTYPTDDELSGDPTAHGNASTLVFGDIQAINTDAGAVRIDEPPFQVDISAIDSVTVDRLDVGGSIQIYGTLSEQSQVLVAEAIVVDMQGTVDRLYTYGTSVLGAILAAGIFLRSWRINWRRLCFEPRREQ